MAVNSHVRRVSVEREAMLLDAARNAFTWLVTGPDPVSIEGRLFPGLPDRRLALDEVRARLLRRGCGQGTRDAVWAHLVLRSRTDGATWTVGCVGVALPALTRIAGHPHGPLRRRPQRHPRRRTGGVRGRVGAGRSAQAPGDVAAAVGGLPRRAHRVAGGTRCPGPRRPPVPLR